MNSDPHRVMLELVERDRKALSRLRSTVLRLNDFVEKNCVGENVEVDEVKNRFAKFNEQVEKDCDLIEMDTKKVDALSQDTHNQQISRLNNFLMDSICDSGAQGVYERAQRLTTNMDASLQYINFTYEFMKTSGSSIHKPKRPNQIGAGVRIEMQKSFEEAITLFQSFCRNRVKTRWLEKGPMGGLLEVKFQQVFRTEPVLQLKALFVVNNGQFEYALVIAPFEEWAYLDDDKTKIDLGAQSKYEIYRRYTHQANVMIPQYSYQYISPDLKNYVAQFLQFFHKMTTFDEVCCQCKKHLKDFQPPIFDPRHSKKPFHESCR